MADENEEKPAITEQTVKDLNKIAEDLNKVADRLEAGEKE